MKPASVVVLILAAILVISGIVFCFIGSSTAEKDGMDLFTRMRDGVPYLKQEFSAGKISKIELIVNDATINITGGDITSYVEFINYNPNLYNLDVTSQTISFDEIENIKSLFNIWENGFGFKGYRNLLSFKSLKSGSGEKTINVHLGDGSLISSIIIKGKKVKVNVQKAEIKKDLKIDADRSDVEINNFATGSSIALSSNVSVLKLVSVSCGMLNVNSADAGIISSEADIRNIDIKLEKGSVYIENEARGIDAEFDFNSKTGPITVDGQTLDSTLYSKKADAEETKYTYKIKTDSASISYKNHTDEPDPEETAAETGAGD